MKKVILTICILSFISFAACSEPEPKAFVPPELSRNVVDVRPFISEDDLFRSLPELPADYGGNPIKALVVPHHTVGAFLSAEAISGLAAQKPSKVIILAPNHENTGPTAASSISDWQCYGNKLSSDDDTINRLASAGLIGLSDRRFATEHSVGMLLPIISHYLPEAKIIPIIFHHGYSEQKLLEIIEALEPETKEGAVMIASIDFSHYLPMKEAEKKDRQMRTYLLNGDAQSISALDSSFIDSPTIMSALLNHFGTKEMTIIENTNSGVILRNPEDGCTSYFTIKFQ